MKTFCSEVIKDEEIIKWAKLGLGRLLNSDNTADISKGLNIVLKCFDVSKKGGDTDEDGEYSNLLTDIEFKTNQEQNVTEVQND